MRTLWFLFGAFFLVVGFVGIFVPLLPTVPFLLLTAVCFARSSDEWHRWLVEHPRFGPPIKDWQRSGAIRRRAKWMATASVAAAFGISILLGVTTYALGLQAVALVGVMIFIWSRPED